MTCTEVCEMSTKGDHVILFFGYDWFNLTNLWTLLLNKDGS